ncbi:hypothetical protein ACQP2F_17295 [Actinoplanes sp. CA-030573]|uniref:hypothetical protein n=1 Tax=Actinoplanes sp. CA-030573 TaxID=3239898 RepID=UPI003D8F895C
MVARIGAESPSASTAKGLSRRTTVTLAAAVIAAAALLAGGRQQSAPPPVGRVTAGQAWPRAARADFPDLPVSPLLFLDARTVVGTLPTRDGAHQRLVIQTPGGPDRELRRLPADGNPQFGSVTAAGGRLVWAELAEHRPWQLWTADLAGGPARRLVPDAGDVTFPGNQHDLVIAQDQVYWAVAAGERATVIRSVPLVGGPPTGRTLDGQWSLSTWPWLTDEASAGTGTTRLRDMATGRQIRISVPAHQLAGCTLSWCRVMVMNPGGALAGIDLMHPDGSGRRRIAGGGAQAAVTDVAVLDRFEILSEPAPDSDLTGAAGLLVYDIATGRTVTISSAAGGVFTHDGMLWWSTGETDLVWHTLDLRTA